MKKLTFLYLIIIFSSSLLAQQQTTFPIYNASLQLAEKIKTYNKIKEPDTTEQKKMYTVLGDYLLKTNQLTEIKSAIDIQKAFRGNKFIWEALKQNNFWAFAVPISMSSNEVKLLSNDESNKSSLLSKVGNLNATIYADAFAKIIVKRFKQDLNELFFMNMKTEMDKSIELKTLFPSTYGGLRMMNNDIYVFNQYIEGLRQKMEEDLGNMFAHTTELLETEQYTKYFQGSQTARGFLTTVTQFADGLIQEQHPGRIIENLHFSSAFDEEPGEGQDLKAGLQIIQLVSAGLRATNATDSTHYWVHGLDNLNVLFKGDGLAAKIWLGSLHLLAVDENRKPIKFQNGKTFRDYLNGLYGENDNISAMHGYVKGLISRVNTIEMAVKDKKQLEGKEGKIYWDKMVSSYENILSLVKFAPTIKDILEPNSAMPRTWYKGIYIAETLARVYAEMKGREYHAAILHIADMIQAVDSRPMYVKKGNDYVRIDNLPSVFTPNALKKLMPVREYKPLLGTYFIDDKQQPISISKIYIDDDSLGKRELDYSALKKFIKYSSFAASLALSRTSDEVANLLERTMTTSGGTHIKESGWLLSINSYLGIQNTFKKKDTLGYFSISAPIGLNLSYGFKRKPKYGLKDNNQFWDDVAPHTIQFFASIIDVGAIAGFRFTNGTDSIPKVKLSNIFSPGLFIQFGRLFNTPLNFGFGYQAQPRLYAVKEESIFLKKFQYRFNMNLSWDIPFWHIKHWGQN
jgi:hypothetical protein